MPCHDTPAGYLAGTLSSITAQSYPNWELCLADDGSSSTATLEVLSRYSQGDPRIQVTHLPENRGIAAASNAALALAGGSLVVPMDHDDLLPEYALATLVEAVTNSPEAKLAYSDSDRIDSAGDASRPFFKPAWNYDLFLAQNYLNHLTAIDAGLLRSVGGWREGYEGSQDYDLYLRLVEVLQRRQILHIPEVLYHWREHPESFSQSRLASAVRAARRAIAEHLQRTSRRGTVSAPPGALIYNHIRWALPERRARLRLILLGSPSPAMAGLIRDGYSGDVRLDIEVRAVDAGPDLVGRIDAELADASGTELVMLLNAATRELPDDALEQLTARSLWEDVGCVGPKCIDSADALVSAPELLEDASDSGELYSRRWRAPAAANRGYFNHLLLHQETDCLPPDAVVFRSQHLADYGALSGRYDSPHLALADFCLSTARRGLVNVWNGGVTLELAGQGLPTQHSREDLSRFRGRWRPQIEASRFHGRDIPWITTERD